MVNAQTSYTASSFAKGITYISGATTVWDGALSSYDDEYSLALPLGFTFKYFGSDYTSVYASTNGWISFYGPSDSEYINENIPTLGTPYGVIAPFWDDFEVKAQGATDKVSYITSGSAPNRIFTIEYYSVTRYGTSESTDFQVKLYETSNVIEFHYGASTLTTGSASIGIENYDGTIGFCGPNCGTSNSSLPSFNYMYVPEGYWIGTSSTSWDNRSNWADGNVPTSIVDVIIPSSYTYAPSVNISNAACASIIVDGGATFSVASGNTITISGTSDINGTLAGAGIFDADGAFDATGGTVSMSGRLKLASTVTSLGTLSAAIGTVEYDGGSDIESSTSSVGTSSLFQSPTATLTLSGLNPLPIGDATLTVYFKGDFNDITENLEIYDENDVLLFTSANTTSYPQCGSTYSSQSHTITQADITALVSDGTTKFKYIGSTSVDGGLCSDDCSVYFNLEYPYQGTASILTENYYNLEIDCDAVNSGTLDIDGDLTLASGSSLNKTSTNLTIAGSYINSGGTLTSAGGKIDFDGSGSETCDAISNTSTSLYISKTSGGSVTTTGNSDFDKIYINSGTYIIDGETITNDNYAYVQGGTLKITSGLFHNTYNVDQCVQLSSTGSIDIEDGEFRVGDLATDNLASLYMTGGTFDISGGTANIAGYLYSTSGTLTQAGGNLNVGAYTGSGDPSTNAMFYKSDGILNLTAGTSTIKSQNPLSSSYAIQITSGVTVNSNANHTTVLDPSGESMYMDLNGKTLGTMIINNSGLYSVFAKDNFTLLGNLTINSDANLESYSNTGNITLNGGSFINNGTFDLNGSNITFTGGNDVTCGAITSDGVGTLVMNKTSASNLLTLTNDVELKVLTLSSGRIVPDANELTIRNSSPGSPSSHVVGLIKLDISTYTSGSIEVPTGDGAVYRPVFIHPEASGSTIYSIKYNNSSHSSVNWALTSTAPVGAGVHHVAGGHWWDVNRISGVTRVKLGFNWNVGVNPSQVDDVDAVAEMLVTHWTGAEWENVMGSNVATGTASSGSVTSDYIDDFSPFTEGSSGPGNPLPVDLLSFNATCSIDIVDIDFTVLSQINNDYFLVERSEDAVNWEVIGNIDGAGNTNTQMDYNFVDANPLASEGYYRLTQVDFDAKSETFWPVITECSTENTGLNLTLYPNPIIDHFTIEIDLEEYQGDDVYYTILDIRGSIVKEDKISLTRGFNKHEIQVEDLSTGAYMLRFANTKSHIKEQRIMVK